VYRLAKSTVLALSVRPAIEVMKQIAEKRRAEGGEIGVVMG